MVLVHNDWNVRIHFYSSLDHMTQECFTGLFTRASGALHNDGAVAFISGLHDCFHLFQIAFQLLPLGMCRLQLLGNGFQFPFLPGNYLFQGVFNPLTLGMFSRLSRP